MKVVLVSPDQNELGLLNGQLTANIDYTGIQGDCQQVRPATDRHQPDVLVAMNPAALKANIRDLPRGADIILNTDEFTKRNLEKVGYATNPIEDGSLEPYNVHAIALTSQTVEALKGFDLTKKEAERSKNMYALGLLCWLYSRPAEGTRAFLEKRPAAWKGQ